MEENKNGFEMNQNFNQTNGQPVKTKKKSKLVSFLVIVIIILILALGLSIWNTFAITKGYDNLFIMLGTMLAGEEEVSGDDVKGEEITDGENELTVNEEKEDIEETLKKEDESKDYVYERESYAVKIQEYPGSNYEDKIEIPYINIDSEDVKKINKEIYEMYEESVKTLEKYSNEYTDLRYEFSEHENMISICIIKTHIVVPGGGFVSSRKVYNVSLENGEELSVLDVLETFDLEGEDLKSKIEEKLEQQYENSTDSSDIKSYPTSKGYIQTCQYDMFNIYFKTENIAVVEIDDGIYGSYSLEFNLKDEK